jgi:arabinose-5-phosphate isomerase
VDIISEVKRIIDIEVAGLLTLQNIINDDNEDIEKAINEIYKCKGKVILTGIGKSGLVARKIASTMASTGTPTVFLHPVEGMHGDLGIIGNEDIVLAISKSGQSNELNNIIQVIKKIGSKIISITGNKESKLARISDLVIFLGNMVEACPFNMTPTTSTTVSLVIGDAIALTLMKMRKFDINDFATLHPGGRIGKRLIMKVSDVMLSSENNPIININATAREMILKISEKQAGSVSVVNDEGKLLGLVTDYDIRKHLEKEENIFSMTIKGIMNSKPIFVYEDQKAFSALELMQNRKKPITVLPVLNMESIVVGMLRLQDLVKEGL